MNEETKRRFWARVDKEGPVPEHVPDLGRCWTWIGKRRSDGRGTLTFEGKKNVRAYRASWEIAEGKPAGEMCVLHRCDNPTCVNPSHLFIGSQLENIQDMRQKQRGRNPPAHVGERNHKTKLTDASVLEIRRRYVAGTTQDELAVQFGVRQATISRIIRGQVWSHLPKTAEFGERKHPRRLHPDRYGSLNKSSKLSVEAVVQIRSACAAGERQRVTAEKHGVSQSTVSSIQRNRTWTHVTSGSSAART